MPKDSSGLRVDEDASEGGRAVWPEEPDELSGRGFRERAKVEEDEGVGGETEASEVLESDGNFGDGEVQEGLRVRESEVERRHRESVGPSRILVRDNVSAGAVHESVAFTMFFH